MSTTANKIIELAAAEVGYKETGSNVTKFSKYFDTTAWQWFNTKKQGAEWCAIFICWLFCQILGPDKARTFLGCPKPADNCAAGVKYFWNYLKAKGYAIDKKQGQPGDIIFFSSNKHVGIIEKVEGGKYHTIEGNKSNAVKRCSYAITSATVCGVARPNWAEVDEAPAPAPAPQPTPAPTPEPAPQPAPSGERYKVKTNGSPLALRVAPNAKATLLAWMPNGSTVIVNGTSGSWSHTTYNGKTGWAFSKWLKKI